MTVTLDPQPTLELNADDLESVEPTSPGPDLLRLVELLAAGYVTTPLFA